MATIPSAIQWPSALDRERTLLWEQWFMNEQSPPTLDGTVQVRNINGGGLWRAARNTVQLRTKAQVLAWQGLTTQLRGGLQPIDVPLGLCAQQPKPSGGGSISIAVVGTTAARAVAMRVVLTSSGEVLPGMHFSDYDASIYGWRLYAIDTVAAVMGQPTQRDITFWPPLRFAAADAHALEFDEPRCVMKLQASDSMMLELDLRKRGDPSAQFIEAF
jgi:hypothetical protein